MSKKPAPKLVHKTLPTKAVRVPAKKQSTKTAIGAPAEVEYAAPVIETTPEPAEVAEPEAIYEPLVPWAHPRSDEAWTKCKDGVWWRPVDKFGGIEVKVADKPIVETTHEVLDQYLSGQISGF